MVATVQQIIGKVNPLLYAENGEDLLKKYGSWEKIPAEEVKSKPIHTLVYDSSSETLEPVYFWLLDFMNEILGYTTEKLADNFSSSPGSGHFAELGQRMTIMQQQGTKILGDINTVMRSVLNIVYDLKEFRIRLEHYDNLRNKNKDKAQAAVLSLKQIWMDRVDISKGNSSIKAMAFQGGFQTLIHAFLVVKDESLKDPTGKEIDLNEAVKRILKPRIQEFNIWLKESEKELRKRYELEKSYLKSQVNALKLYSRWAKPYLKSAQDLAMKESSRDADFIKTFNTIILELSILGKVKMNVQKSAIEGKLPIELKNLMTKRDYFSCALVNFRFRGIPQRVGQQSHFSFGGRTEVNFFAYALNSDELEKINEELSKSDLGDVLNLIEGATTESINQLQEDINFFLEDKEKEESKKPSDESNPFLALIGYYDKDNTVKKPDEKKIKPLVPDDWIEKTQIRALAADDAKERVFNLFDIYKKAHGMQSYT